MSIIFEFLLTKKSFLLEKVKRHQIDLTKKIGITFIHLMVVFLIYLNMLGLMTYNGSIILSIILGNIVGFMLFGNAEQNKLRKIENVGCCHSG